jgi:hypothetical protein
MMIVLYFKVSYKKASENCVQNLSAEPRLQSLILRLSQPARTKSVILVASAARYLQLYVTDAA